jgi:pimeloyl-ACP methyl ester carboxylesterase
MIDGGPGVGVSNWIYFYTEEYENYRKYHDIVFIDVRGTGRSQPLHCIELQTKKSPQEHFGETYQLEELNDCIQNYSDSIDFNNYNTQYIIEDLDEIREWLGYKKVNLYGVSYGGKVALVYMNTFPNSIHKAVLHAPSLPWINNHIERSIYAQQAVELLFERCMDDTSCFEAYPHIADEFRELQMRIENEPLKLKVGVDNDKEIIIEWGYIAEKIFSMLYTDSEYIHLPYIINEAYNENYDPLLSEFNFERTEPNLFFADGMFLSVICSEEIKLDTDIDQSYNDTFLGDFTFKQRLSACDNWPVEDISDQYSEGIFSDIPTLVFTGALDPVVSSKVVDAYVSKNLTNVNHIVLPYMGHMLSNLSNIDCYDDYIVSFYNGTDENFDMTCFSNMKPQSFKLPPQNEK